MISRFLFWILTHFVFIVGKSFPGETICHLLLQMAAILARFDKNLAQQYWTNYLRDVTEPSRINLLKASRPLHVKSQHYLELNAASTQRLNDFARQQGLTMASIAQNIYSYVLARMSGLEEIIIGAVRSGRSPELSHSETALGLFINTLPIRTKVNITSSVGDWLRQQQKTVQLKISRRL